MITRQELAFGQRGIDLGSVKADDNGPVDVDNRDTHLARLFDRFFGVFGVLFDVMISVFDALFIKILFSGVAECTPGGGVDSYRWLRIAHTLMIVHVLGPKC